MNNSNPVLSYSGSSDTSVKIQITIKIDKITYH